MDNLDFIPSQGKDVIPNYKLPNDRIATFPLPQRDASRLLMYKHGSISDHQFSDLPDLLPNDSHLLLNNTKVIEARVYFQKNTGGMIEIFCLEPYHPAAIEAAMQAKNKCQWRCLIGGASKWKHGLVLEKKMVIEGSAVELKARFLGKKDDHFLIEFSWDGEHRFAAILHQAGNIPLPPYIKRKTVESDEERYQTIFHRIPGSVAAPTASLHFSENVFTALRQINIDPSYVTLHVGAGTFMPVKSDTLKDHHMHAENFTVTASTLQKLVQAKTIIAAGTTTLRTLESLYWISMKMKKDPRSRTLDQWEAYTFEDRSVSYAECMQQLLGFMAESGETELHCSTRLLMMPGYRVRSAHALITNFHQPRSTLLALVAAFVGDNWKNIYHHALDNNYRFLSYGDSSLLWREER